MIDLFLKFANKAEADTLLFTTGESGDQYPLYRNVDVIGTMYKPTGDVTVDEDGIEIPVVAPAPGWHVNVRLMPDEDGSSLEQYRVYPTTPSRVWA
jgi:hypothetical protein